MSEDRTKKGDEAGYMIDILAEFNYRKWGVARCGQLD